MIGKISKSSSIKATTRYVLEKEGAEIIGGNLFGQTSGEIIEEFSISLTLNPDIERPVYHLTQSYSYADKETNKLNSDFLAKLATIHFAGMVVSANKPEILEDTKAFTQCVNQFLRDNLHDYQFLIAVHKDRGHVHTHLVASRINLTDGKCIPTWYERVRNLKVCRILETRFKLEQLQNRKTKKTLDPITRDRIIQTAPIMERALNYVQQNGKPVGTSRYSLVRQGETLIYRRISDDSVALKAYRDKQGKWNARQGNLTEQEWKAWQDIMKFLEQESNPKPHTREPQLLTQRSPSRDKHQYMNLNTTQDR